MPADDETPILDPNRPHVPASADQFAAEMADRILAGLAAGLAASMQRRTLETGPWLLMGDGRLYRVDTPDPPYADVAEMLADHVRDWGRCDHPLDCACSDARARRLLAAKAGEYGAALWLAPDDDMDRLDRPEQHPEPPTDVLLVWALEAVERLTMWAADDDMPQYRRNEARDLAAAAGEILP